MRFPANCVVVALIAVVAGCSAHSMRNRYGRLHFFWRNHRGEAFEFSRPGIEKRPYWQQVIYLGEIRRAPALDAGNQRV